MQQTRGFVVALAMTTLLTGASAAKAGGSVQLDADTQVAFNLGGATVHCGDTLTQHTKLTRDLNCPGSDPFALRLDGEDIVLDLGGFTVRRTGPVNEDSQGIVVVNGRMIRNGTVQGFGRGIITAVPVTVANLRLHKLALLDNGVAVFSQSSTNFLITECRLSGNGAGLDSEFDASTGVFDVRSSVFTHNGTAMFADFHFIDVRDSTFTSNELVGFCFGGAFRFRTSTLAGNTSVAAMRVDLGGPFTCGEMRFENSLIADNTAFATPTDPVWETNSFAMIDTLAVNNGTALPVAALRVYVDGNTFFDNTGGGLILSDLPASTPVPLVGIVRGNQFLSNDGDGLRVLPPSTPTVLNNVALGNTGFGINAPTAFDGGGNVARDNDAGDCVGIICAPF
ncbi:right-handed parallel beta-helix repeat-containing protein [Corallococcus sp. CA054B]|uniref:right-handed parallel beta-helix repeat-containing protein n=1 Tax=Corallococcus sp. CA054B TaxID=2316734 RepID=UPI000EA2E791|nr:right-handed parallel beta-helix repeat-containing protein [Corallococcus sp. CA054B]RKG65988.1 right-handed parallel beta-helix repeat-containing protein [Corallococcus sp. CA054B]